MSSHLIMIRDNLDLQYQNIQGRMIHEAAIQKFLEQGDPNGTIKLLRIIGIEFSNFSACKLSPSHVASLHHFIAVKYNTSLLSDITPTYCSSFQLYYENHPPTMTMKHKTTSHHRRELYFIDLRLFFCCGLSSARMIWFSRIKHIWLYAEEVLTTRWFDIHMKPLSNPPS